MSLSTMRGEAGLSLLELLISLALLALITTFSYPSLSTVLASWRSIAFDTTPADDYAAARFLRHHFEQAMEVFERERSTREKLLVFDGDAEKVTFVAPLSSFGADGRKLLSLSTLAITEKSSLQRQELSFTYRPYRPGLADSQQTINRELVVANLSNATFRYYSAKRNKWVAEWKDAKTLPIAVRLDFTKPDEQTSSWFFELKLAMRSDGGSK